MKLSIIPLVCVTLLLAAASAFQPLVTDDTGTQGAGGNQVEAAYHRTVDKASGTRDVTHEVPLVFPRGVTDAFDLYAGLGYQRIVPPAPDGMRSVTAPAPRNLPSARCGGLPSGKG